MLVNKPKLNSGQLDKRLSSLDMIKKKQNIKTFRYILNMLWKIDKAKCLECNIKYNDEFYSCKKISGWK